VQLIDQLCAINVTVGVRNQSYQVADLTAYTTDYDLSGFLIWPTLARAVPIRSRCADPPAWRPL
jgi:hypothetical protein